jgi:glycosyltransferase involved in cell wall biosynthesis
MKPKFSLLTCCYNNKKYLDDWGNCILKQDYRPLEVVFVDDNSNDGSFAKWKEWALKINQHGITTIDSSQSERSYYGTSCYNAQSLATGDFFGILDADDAIKPNAVGYIMDLYEKHQDIAWIYTQFEICNIDLSFRRGGFSCAPSHGESILSMGLKGKHTYSHWRTWSRRIERLDKIFPKGQKSAVDKYMGYRLEEFGKGMFCPTTCYSWRTGNKSSISYTEPSKMMWKKVMKEASSRRKKYGHKPSDVRVLTEKVVL